MHTIANLKWHEDDCGDCWTADLSYNGKKCGVTGNYYDVDENNERLSKEEQLAELKELGWLDGLS